MKITVHRHSRPGKPWVVGRFIGGKRVRTSFATKAEAEAEAARLRLEVNQAGREWLALSAQERQCLMMAYAEAKKRGLNLWELLARLAASGSGSPG
jgi:hypothetical protein